MKKCLTVIVFLLGLVILADAQVKKTPVASGASRTNNTPPPGGKKRSKLYGVARPTRNEILIRWAPDDFAGWQKANQYGYVIEKYTIVKEGKLLKQFEPAKPVTIKPKTLAEWEPLIDKNDYAAVIAQALYGEDFDVSMDTDTSGLSKIINQTQKTQQRFTMAMYAADHSFEAAGYAGLAWTDQNVKPGDRYFYRIYSLVPKSVRVIDTAMLYVGLEDFKPLPKPSEILAEFADKAAILRWDYDAYKEYYTSYIVERSDDGGKTFAPVSDKAVTSLAENKEGEGKSMYFLDTIPDNDREFKYRVAGISLFGDKGPYSPVVSGKGKHVVLVTPGITHVSETNNGKYLLHWQLEDSVQTFVKGFKINRSKEIDGPYQAVSSLITADTRSVELDSLDASNYFTVTAITKDGDEKTSLPYMLQPADSIPPAVPTGFKALIDSNGVVRLSWNKNAEKDFAGYRVFKTNMKEHEMIPLFDSLWTEPSFTDTVNLKSLNGKVFYTVKAVDKRFNESGYAPMAEVIKPDIIAPTQPVFADYEIQDDGIRISWINSQDADVVTHNLYRKETGTANAKWELLQSFRGQQTQQLLDKKCEGGKTYSYTLIAVDSSKLESDPAVPLTVFFPEKHIKKALKAMAVEVDRENRTITIAWEQLPDVKNIRQFELYRGEEKKPIGLYQQLDAKMVLFTDTDLKVNTKYKYAVRAVYTNGQYSDFISKNVIY